MEKKHRTFFFQAIGSILMAFVLTAAIFMLPFFVVLALSSGQPVTGLWPVIPFVILPIVGVFAVYKATT